MYVNRDARLVFMNSQILIKKIYTYKTYELGLFNVGYIQN